MHIWQVCDLKIYLASAIWDAYLASVRFEGIFGKHHLGCIFGKCEIRRYIWQAPLEVFGNPAVLLAPWTAVVVAAAPSILICKRRHVSCAPARTQEEAYLANVCSGRICAKYPIEMPMTIA